MTEIEERAIRCFVSYLHTNYKKTKTGWRHKGDFYKNDKPKTTEAVMERYFKEEKIIKF